MHARDELVGEQVLRRRRHRLRSVRGGGVGALRQADKGCGWANELSWAYELSWAGEAHTGR